LVEHRDEIGVGEQRGGDPNLDLGQIDLADGVSRWIGRNDQGA